MSKSILVRAFVAACVLIPIAGCSNSIVGSIAVSPTAQSLSVGQTVQFKATGIFPHRTASSTTEDLTNQVTWTSSVPAIATVNSSGLATAVSAGSTTITATTAGYTGTLTATATVTVTGLGSGTGGGGTVVNVSSLAIIPSSQSVSSPGQTGQFIAIGTTSSGATLNLTSQVAWSSSSAQIASISSTGLATAIGQGTATITALYTNSSGGSTITGNATFTVSSGTTQQFTAVTILPGTQSVSASGQTGQFIALATMGGTGLQQDVTNSSQIQWASSIPSIATITSGQPSGNGLVKGVSAGSTTITAELRNVDGSVVSNTAAVAVTLTPAPVPLLSIELIPTSITVGNLQDTGNFIAVGTFSQYPYIRDITNSVTWLSSTPNVFPVVTANGSTANSGVPAGTVTAYGAGSATIIAEANDPAITGGSIQIATATFTCPIPTDPPKPGQCYQGSQVPALLATVTIYNEGLNTTNWEVTAPSATGTQNVIHCGPGWALNGGTGGSVCVATYPIGTALTLTAPDTGAKFGGWSTTCLPPIGTISPSPSTETGTNTCTFTISGTNPNVSVGVIFN
jgi:uncharacterized protein YjdB